jgi:hypothetical protein
MKTMGMRGLCDLESLITIVVNQMGRRITTKRDPHAKKPRTDGRRKRHADRDGEEVTVVSAWLLFSWMNLFRREISHRN